MEGSYRFRVLYGTYKRLNPWFGGYGRIIYIEVFIASLIGSKSLVWWIWKDRKMQVLVQDGLNPWFGGYGRILLEIK